MIEVKCTAWKAVDKGKVVGFAALYLPDIGATLIDCMVLQTTNGKWCKPPSRPILGKDGKQATREDGTKSFADVLKFDDRDASDGFSEAALKAIALFIGKAEDGLGQGDEIPF